MGKEHSKRKTTTRMSWNQVWRSGWKHQVENSGWTQAKLIILTHEMNRWVIWLRNLVEKSGWESYEMKVMMKKPSRLSDEDETDSYQVELTSCFLQANVEDWLWLTGWVIWLRRISGKGIRKNMTWWGKNPKHRKGRVARSKPVVLIWKCRCDV